MPAPRPAVPAGRKVAIIAAAAAVLLLVGVGTAVAVARLVGGGGGLGKQSGMTVAWTIDYTGERSANDREAERVYAAWTVDDLLVRVLSDGVIAYRLADGSQVWGVPVPSGTSVCTATPTADNGIGVVSYGRDEVCDKIAGVDVRTGKQTFEATLPKHDYGRFGPPPGIDPPLLTGLGDTVVAATDKFVMAYGLTDGRRKWVRPADKFCQINRMAATGSTVLFGQFCRSKFLVAVDAATGKLRWSTEFPERSILIEILSAEPAVVDLADANLDHAVVSYDAKGHKQAQTPKTVGGFELDLSRMGFSRDGQPRLPLAVVGTTMYVKTTSWRGGGSYQNQVVAIDVTTGKMRWSSSGHSESRFHLIRAEADHLLGFEEGGFREQPRLVRIAADSGKVSTAADVSVDDDFHLPFEPDLREKDGTLVVLSLSRNTDGRAVTTLR